MTTTHVWYDVKQQEADVRDPAGLDALIYELAAGPEPIMLSLFRPEDVVDGMRPEIEFLVGIGRDPRFALIQCGDLDGLWYTLSASTGDQGEVFYNYMHNATDYPANAEVPIAQVVAAVHEFAATGKRPSAVAWQRVER